MKRRLILLVLITSCAMLLASSALSQTPSAPPRTSAGDKRLAEQPQPPEPAAATKRLIPVPRALADDYARALETETAALNIAQATPAWKDFQTAQQQRLKIENYLFGELGCKPSRAHIPRDEQGRVIVNKDGRIEAIECLEAKDGRP